MKSRNALRKSVAASSGIRKRDMNKYRFYPRLAGEEMEKPSNIG
jgi:hypothetical protein